MKIQIASDIHLEFPYNLKHMQDNPLEVVGDILVIAGDIMTMGKHDIDIFDVLSQWNDDYELVIYIAGNHEYYGSDVQDITKRCKPFPELDNIIQVNQDVIVHKGIDFVCASLWAPGDVPTSRCLYDFSAIQGMTLDKFRGFYESDADFISDYFKDKKGDNKTVVVTHHLPSQACVSQRFIGNPINAGFVGPVDELFKYHPALWIHGHSHDFFDAVIDGVRNVRNPLGYVHQREHGDFRRDFVIDV